MTEIRVDFFLLQAVLEPLIDLLQLKKIIRKFLVVGLLHLKIDDWLPDYLDSSTTKREVVPLKLRSRRLIIYRLTPTENCVTIRHCVSTIWVTHCLVLFRG